MSWWKQKVWKVPLLLWFIVVAALASIVTGAIVYTLTLHGKVTIVEVTGNFSIKVYSDAQCTTEMTSFDLGDASAGEFPVSVTFWIKNTGDTTITRFGVSTDLPSDVGSLGNIAMPRELKPGSVAKATLNFQIANDPPVGTFEFDVYIDCIA